VDDALSQATITVPAQGFKLTVVSDGASLSYLTAVTDIWDSENRAFVPSPLRNNTEGLAGIFNDDTKDDFF